MYSWRRSFRMLLSAVLCGLLSVSSARSQDDSGSFYRPGGFGAFSGGDLNISSFVFRDSNRNASFDVGERPLAGIAVEMIRPDGSRLVRRSNVSGFANFVMSVLKRDADIVEEGRYRFVAKIPPTWELTTGNAEQVRRFRLLPGAPADIVSLDPAEFLGFAPVLTISGRVARRPDSPPPALTAIAPGGEAESVALGPEGDFSFAAGPGEWRLEMRTGAGSADRRGLQVAETPVVVSSIGPAAAEPDPAPVEKTVDFEELLKHEGVAEIPSGIGGLGWRNWIAAHNRTYGGEGYVNATISGEFVGYNSSGHPAEIFSDAPFDFVGGYFGAAWSGAEGETLRITAWRGSDLVYHDRIELSALGPVYFSADYRAVSRLEFATEHYWQLAVDDLSFRLPE